MNFVYVEKLGFQVLMFFSAVGFEPGALEAFSF